MAKKAATSKRPETADTVEKIIAAAETRMRSGGFHGFSFRDIAADVGIKSASVHHHFPTKADLAVAVVRAYTDREIDVLGDPSDPSRKPATLLSNYIKVFRDALVDTRSMCLCGLLASESASTPKLVNDEVQRFFTENLKWTETVIGRLDPSLKPAEVRSKALALTATLEGALLGSHCQGDVKVFDAIAKEIKTSLIPART